MYVNRTYRTSHAHSEGRVAFVARHRKSDLWLAIDRESWADDLPDRCERLLAELWKEMEEYLSTDPDYAKSLVPRAPLSGAPTIFRRMSYASLRAGIGPMGGVAAACSEWLAERLRAERGVRELIIENGGDVYAISTEPVDVAIHAGASPLSGRVGFRVISDGAAVGICTSSGTVGPSLSLGVADAVMAVCRDAVLADCYATAYGNRVQSVEDVERVAEELGALPEVMAAAVIKADRIALAGRCEVKLFK